MHQPDGLIHHTGHSFSGGQVARKKKKENPRKQGIVGGNELEKRRSVVGIRIKSFPDFV
jgi:hypothetical protein